MNNTLLLNELSFINEQRSAPVLILPNDIGQSIDGWARNNASVIEDILGKYGAILFRKFKINGAKDFERTIEAFDRNLLEYRNRSTPRSIVHGKVYTSTEYPPNESIPLHNENSYTRSWAQKIFFFCVISSEVGGETPIADSRRVFDKINKDVRDEFINKKVRYVRNYGCLDLPWQEVFQTQEKDQVEAFCEQAAIEYEWKPDGSLRTWQVCDAVQTHPVTKEKVWFNQAHLFHVSSLKSQIAESLLSSLGEENLPRHAYFGDGSPIGKDLLDEINRVYREEEIVFPWRSGDVLLLDNMLMAHGRKTFEGKRRVLVGMTGEVDGRNIEKYKI